MPIIRSKPVERYFLMHNATAQDSNLSWAARGMLTYLLSQPPEWKTSLESLARQSRAGVDACRTIFNELIAVGYAKRVEVRCKGRISYDTYVYDRPQDMTTTSLDPPHAVEPDAVGPEAVEPSPVDPMPYKERNLENTDLQKTNSEITEGSAPAARATPSREILKLNLPVKAPTDRRSRRVTRLPDDWRPSAEDIHYARNRGFDDDHIHDIAENFATYWQAGSGRNKTHLDWPRAWQTWVRRENPRSGSATRAPPQLSVMDAFDEIDRSLRHEHTDTHRG